MLCIFEPGSFSHLTMCQCGYSYVCILIAVYMLYIETKNQRKTVKVIVKLQTLESMEFLGINPKDLGCGT